MNPIVSGITSAAGALALGLTATTARAAEVKASSEYPEFYNGDSTKGIDFVQSIKVLAPAYTSYVKGDVTVVFEAKGMTHAIARCWGIPKGCDMNWGADVVLADITLGADAMGEFVLPADQFPNGPLTIRIQARDEKSSHQDYCELQVFNLGGIPWKQGLPKADPPGAKGMKLVYADDFDGPLSISSNGNGAKYAAHKTGGGDFSGWTFSDPDGDDNPFGQRGTYLRIHGTKAYGAKTGRSGILSSLHADGTGVCVPVPSYFECRFICHSAPGSWGAFWTLTRGTHTMDKSHPDYQKVASQGCDELDIIECYGGYGPHNPNHGGHYGVTTHFWGQDKTRPAWSKEKLADGSKNPDYIPPHRWLDAMEYGGRSSWSWTPHTYGCAITETDTVYYLDDIEILRHPTGPVSLSQPTWFLINYAIGGISGWPIDMERYENRTDMWVDFVRVYCGSAQAPEIEVDGFAGRTPAHVTCKTVTPGAKIRYTLDGSEPTESSTLYAGPVAVDHACTFRAVVFADGIKPSPSAAAAIRKAPGAEGSIGINFVTDLKDESQVLLPTEVVGIGQDEQGNWNNVQAGSQPMIGLKTADGQDLPIGLALSGDAKPERGEPWGFNGLDFKLKKGNLASNAKVILTKIPFERYDVVVHLGAGIHNVQGDVTLSTTDGAVLQGHAFNFGWNGGKYEFGKTPAGGDDKCSTYLRFENVSAKDLVVAMKWRGGKGWTGLAGLQIIPRQ